MFSHRLSPSHLLACFESFLRLKGSGEKGKKKLNNRSEVIRLVAHFDV